MRQLSQAEIEAIKTMADMQRQGRMSHAERLIIERTFGAVRRDDAGEHDEVNRKLRMQVAADGVIHKL